jgi:AraC-like DNA-binding protein
MGETVAEYVRRVRLAAAVQRLLHSPEPVTEIALAVGYETHAAFTEQLFHHLVQQSARAYGPATLDELRRSFAGSGFHMRKLAVEVMARTALQPRQAADAAARR